MITKNKSSNDDIRVGIIYYKYLSRWETLGIKSQLRDFRKTRKVYSFGYKISRRTPIELVLEPLDSVF